MAGIVAEAGASQEAAAIALTVHRSRDCDGSFAGRTHARNPLPRLGFTA